MLPLLALLGITSVAHAGDVLVPSYTPATLSDFGPAERLTEETLQALSKREIVYVTPAEIQRRAGAIADGCADEKDCTTVLWRHFPPARLAVVGTVTWNEGLLDARVRFYGPDDVSPIEVISSSFPESEIPRFADQVAFFAEELLGLVPEREVGAMPVATLPEQRDRYEGLEEDPKPERRPDGEAVGKGPSRQAAGMLPRRVWHRYQDSGLTWKRFKERELIRSGSVIVEISGQALFGDVDRSYDVRVAVEQQVDNSMRELALYQDERFITGTGWGVGAGVGYLPLWFLEVGMSGGLQVGKKHLSTGWQHYLSLNYPEPVGEEGNKCDPGALCASKVQDYEPAASFMGRIEPRLRFYALPTGPVKPYATTSLGLRFYDGYDVPQSKDIDYRDRSGGTSLGIGIGAGAAFDIPGGFAAFVEVPWTFLLSPDPYTLPSSTITDIPPQKKRSGQILGFTGGVGFRI